jgi:uncharacterized protein with GYD domain
VGKYLVKASYNAEGIRGVAQEGGSARKAAAEQLLASLGGSVEAFYFAFGPTDVYAIIDVPDNVTAAAGVAAVGSAETYSSVETVVLLTPAEIDEAMKKAVNFRPPGG